MTPVSIGSDSGCGKGHKQPGKLPAAVITISVSAMQVTAGGTSKRGPHRKQNEDAWRIYQDQAMVKRSGRGFIYSVADGVGGTGAGRYASWHVVDGISFFYNVPADRFDPGNTMKEVILKAHTNLKRLREEDQSYNGAASTLAMLYVSPSGARKGYMLGIGDSGVFVSHDGGWAQLNTDHCDDRGKVISSIGGNKPLQLSFRRLRYHDGDRYLLCSDGVRNELTDEQLHRFLLMDEHPQEVSRLIVDASEAHGGHDNMTAVVVRFGDCPPLPVVPDPLDD